MQGDVVFKDNDGKELWRGTASNFPLHVECDSYDGMKQFIVRYSFIDVKDPVTKKNWTHRDKIKGLVMMKP